ncbi:MAG: adhesin [Cardiobacteriaceae bacterium]|nr:adhesin [Cardiobacteriaceae bacterium]
MKLLHTSVLLLLAGFSAASLAADEGSVNYQCQSGKSVKVHYKFNNEGMPTSASATLNGKTRTMRYDQGSSDNVDTIFQDGNGYRVSSSYMDVYNYRQQSVMIMSPGGEILYKSCAPSKTKKKQAAKSSKGSGGKRVSYMCQGDRRLNVSYRFNAQGLPVSATAHLKGRDRTLNYDQGASDNVDTLFSGQGYRISSEYMDSGNYRNLPVMVTAPNDEILYKSCMPN